MTRRNKAILITGGSRRLGLAIARACLADKYNVIIHYRTSAQPAKRILHGLDKNEDRCFFIQGDLREHPERLIDQALSLPVSLEGLVNNASVFTEGNLEDPDHFEDSIRVNALAPMRLSQRFFEKVTKGWIVNITDANIYRPNKRFQNYRISKLLLETLTFQQAFLYAPSVRVNAIAPGAILKSPDSTPEYFKQLAEKIPLHRTGDLKSFIDAFQYLVKAKYVTGEILYVDGGWRL